MGPLSFPSLYGDSNVDGLLAGDDLLRYLLVGEPVSAGAPGDVTVSAVLYVGIIPQAAARPDVSAAGRVLIGAIPRSSPSVVIYPTGSEPLTDGSGQVLTDGSGDAFITPGNPVAAHVGVVSRAVPLVSWSMVGRVVAGFHTRSAPVVDIPVDATADVGVVSRAAPLVSWSMVGRVVAGFHTRGSPVVDIPVSATTSVGVFTYAQRLVELVEVVITGLLRVRSVTVDRTTRDLTDDRTTTDLTDDRTTTEGF